MDSIQKALNEQLKKLPGQFLEKIVARKLKEAKVEDAENIAPKLAAHILAGNDSVLTIDDGGPARPLVNIELTADDLEEIKRKTNDFMADKFPEVLQDATKKSGEDLAKALRKNWPDQAEWQDATTAGFLYNLDARWGEAIDFLRMLLTITREIGAARAKRYVRRKTHKQPALHDVLFRLHARSCQVTEEIITLLQQGFADGAMARWRTLYEIGVVMSVLAEHGEELALRYVDHEVVEAKAAMDDYEKRMVPLGEAPYPAREKAKITKGFDAALAKYGKGYRSMYGWAAHHLNKPKPIFPDLEAAAKRSQMRPYYRMASYNVHASPKGIFFRLGSLDHNRGAIAGRSNAGLADPGAQAAHALVLITFMLFGPKFSISDLIQMRSIAELGLGANDAILRAHRKLVRDDKRYRKEVAVGSKRSPKRSVA
jgi:hypothetical protein